MTALTKTESSTRVAYGIRAETFRTLPPPAATTSVLGVQGRQAPASALSLAEAEALRVSLLCPPTLFSASVIDPFRVIDIVAAQQHTLTWHRVVDAVRWGVPRYARRWRMRRRSG